MAASSGSRPARSDRVPSTRHESSVAMRVLTAFFSAPHTTTGLTRVLNCLSNPTTSAGLRRACPPQSADQASTTHGNDCLEGGCWSDAIKLIAIHHQWCPRLTPQTFPAITRKPCNSPDQPTPNGPESSASRTQTPQCCSSTPAWAPTPNGTSESKASKPTSSTAPTQQRRRAYATPSTSYCQTATVCYT